ncbi:MAG: DUF58 domain-containing protein, partial [Polyangiales bacterium]
EPLLHTVAPVLVMMWIFMIGTLVMRYVEGLEHRGPYTMSHWEHVDVLTASGSAVMWLSCAALLAARGTGWASLSVIGILGFGTMFVSVAWTAIAAGGMDRWRSAVIKRTVIPEISVEGDELREEVELSGVSIPIGTRLFATGQAMRHGATTRYTVGAEGSRSSLKLASELGPAMRGEHQAPPLTLWLGDVLGLTRTPNVMRGETAFTVMPRPRTLEGAECLLDLGGDDASSRQANQMPTEGTFKIRNYVPGDDTRRIHWVRSAQQEQLVVRLPDELPPAAPFVRVILDNDLLAVDSLSTRAPDDLLDALVRVWIGVGRALAEQGTRVTLVTALPHDGAFRTVERKLRTRAQRDDQRLGARVAWQSSVPLDQLVGKKQARCIVISSRPRRMLHADSVAWVIVPEGAWTQPEDIVRNDGGLTHQFPSGSAENRPTRRKREAQRLERQWQDRNIFSQVACWTDWRSYSGHHIARPKDDGIALAVIP